ncbi:hypothetical protein [Dictyobacter arantiisoli]|uniref:Uncharacterized protein n=1 Tax=Dictyobacter arantiisoli TaxID=2014874 RepID=A0A5A5T9E8_9CHLR|nr:hypothetical protein [Dictyobacter arantiisoli]GCF08120.1 hypothetical protein KDI_16840 [Dictyobacter arantiisoli]
MRTALYSGASRQIKDAKDALFSISAIQDYLHAAEVYTVLAERTPGLGDALAELVSMFEKMK